MQEAAYCEAAYSVKAAKTNAPIKTARAATIRARKTLVTQANAETGI